LTDVDQQSDPTDGDTVVWNDTLKLWEFSAGGYTNLTQFVAQTAWRSFYSDGSGDVKELAFGDAGKVLTSNGASSAPSWETVSSSQWTTAGTSIYYNTGNVGMGTSAPVQKLQVNGRVRANDFISDQTATFAYNGNGTVNTITKGTRVLTFSYNGDGTINTVGDGALTSTFSYNGDGTIAAITKA
jgi:hypothetical protein